MIFLFLENYIFTRFNLHIGTGTDAKRKYKKDISDFYEYMYKWHDDGTWRVGLLVCMSTMTLVGSRVLGLLNVLKASGSGNSLIERYSGSM